MRRILYAGGAASRLRSGAILASEADEATVAVERVRNESLAKVCFLGQAAHLPVSTDHTTGIGVALLAFSQRMRMPSSICNSPRSYGAKGFSASNVVPFSSTHERVGKPQETPRRPLIDFHG